MARILVLTTDLPFFPGRNGHDFFNLRHLATTERVGLVAPRYPWMPEQGVANIRAAVTHAFLWPDCGSAGPLLVHEMPMLALRRGVERLPASLRKEFAFRLLGIHRDPADAIEKLAILANCAPAVLSALARERWDAFLLIQSSLHPWLRFLPRGPFTVAYFHDVRSDYQNKVVRTGISKGASMGALRKLSHQEYSFYTQADAVGFVSDLDRTRAEVLWGQKDTSFVAPIPIDENYFVPSPKPEANAKKPIILFTGHLGHPPNVDAVRYFLTSIWPRVKQLLPDAIFQAVGMLPAEELVRMFSEFPGVELHSNVPDIRPYFWNAAVYIVPMRYGGGVRQKILEAWSMRVPVVCTTMAAEGLPVESGRDCWLEDTPESFASRILSIIAGATPTQAVADHSQRVVREKYSISSAAAPLQKTLSQSCGWRKARPFSLLYDLRWMEIGKAGGAEQMTHELIRSIARLDSRNSYSLFGPRNTLQEWDFPKEFRAQRHPSDATTRRWETLSAALTNRLLESVGQPAVLTPPMRTLRAFNKMGVEMVHSMIGYIHPDLESFPNILTIHDLQHLQFPEFFGQAEWRERENLYRRSAQRAQHILCISEFTRQQVHRLYDIPLERLSTVWNIPSEGVWGRMETEAQGRLLRQMGIDCPYLFFPAHPWPHKNHARLVASFARVLHLLPSNLRLVMTGKPFAPTHKAATFIKEHNLGERIMHLGYRSPLEVKALYHGCEALVFPSLFEGFGMPVAEAIIAGKPVLCSETTSLPEIAGDAALYFDPTSDQSLGQAMVELMGSASLRAKLTAACARRRALFSSRKVAVQTLSIYQKVHDECFS